MNSDDIFVAADSESGKYAAVYEFDGDVTYFYLLDLNAADEKKIVAAIRIDVRVSAACEDEVSILWTADENHVALLVRGELVAVFDARERYGYGGNGNLNGPNDIPVRLKEIFGKA